MVNLRRSKSAMGGLPPTVTARPGVARNRPMSQGWKWERATPRRSRPIPTPWAGDKAPALLLLDLLGEVVLEPSLLDERELRLQPVGVLLLVLQDVLEQVGRAVVRLRPAQLDALVEHRDRPLFQVKVDLELLVHALTDVDVPELLEIREAVEVQDALDHLVGVLHLVDGLVAYLVPQPPG